MEEKMEPKDSQGNQSKPKKKKSLLLMIIIGLVGLCIFGAIISSLSENDEGEDPVSSKVENQSETNENILPSPTPTEIPLAPAFEEIQEKVNGMTEVQWKDYLPTLEGLRVSNWTGEVVDVDQSGSSYKVWVDMNPGDFISVQDVYLEGLTKDQVIDITKGSTVQFSGIISNVQEFLGDVSINISDVQYEIIN